MTGTVKESILVIGAGIIGISCAHYLMKKGYDVTVIDKDTVAAGCSQSNCGQILPSHILPLNDLTALKTAFFSMVDKQSTFKVKPRLDLKFMKWMWHFVKHCSSRHRVRAAKALQQILESSFQEYIKLISEEGFQCGWKQNGLLYLFQNEPAFHNFKKVNNWCRENFDVEADLVRGEALTSFDPALEEDLSGGYFYPKDAYLKPEKIAHDWASSLKSQGVKFIEHCEFFGLEKTGKQVTVVNTSQGEFRPDHVVLATGALSNSLGVHFGRDIPVEPGKGYSVTIERPQSLPKSSLVLPEVNIAITPFDDCLRLGSMMEFVGFDKTLPESRMTQLVEMVQPYLKANLKTPILEKWFGWRPMTWDSLPIIGRAPQLENTYFATGHNMIGVMAAPATGKLIAEIISGDLPHIEGNPFSPSRFK